MVDNVIFLIEMAVYFTRYPTIAINSPFNMLVASPIYVYEKMSIQPLKSLKITETYTLAGWWLSHPFEKYESQLG